MWQGPTLQNYGTIPNTDVMPPPAFVQPFRVRNSDIVLTTTTTTAATTTTVISTVQPTPKISPKSHILSNSWVNEDSSSWAEVTFDWDAPEDLDVITLDISDKILRGGSSGDLEFWEVVEQRLEQMKQTHNSTEVESKGLFPDEYFVEIDDEKKKPSQRERFVDSFIPIGEITDDQLLAADRAKISPYRTVPHEITIYCYPFGIEEIMEKCLFGVQALKATGLYIPMMTESQTEREAEYYAALATLKETLKPDGSAYKVYGVAYDNPNWSLITQIVRKYNLFDGVMIEWVGRNACIWNINPPSRGQLDAVLDKAGPLMYFYRMQECEDEFVRDPTVFVNSNEEVETTGNIHIEKGKYPKFLKPVFPCFQGQEGPCFNAFRHHAEAACNSERQVRIDVSEFNGVSALLFQPIRAAWEFDDAFCQ